MTSLYVRTSVSGAFFSSSLSHVPWRKLWDLQLQDDGRRSTAHFLFAGRSACHFISVTKRKTQDDGLQHSGSRAMATAGNERQTGPPPYEQERSERSYEQERSYSQAQPRGRFIYTVEIPSDGMPAGFPGGKDGWRAMWASGPFDAVIHPNLPPFQSVREVLQRPHLVTRFFERRRTTNSGKLPGTGKEEEEEEGKKTKKMLYQHPLRSGVSYSRAVDPERGDNSFQRSPLRYLESTAVPGSEPGAEPGPGSGPGSEPGLEPGSEPGPGSGPGSEPGLEPGWEPAREDDWGTEEMGPGSEPCMQIWTVPAQLRSRDEVQADMAARGRQIASHSRGGALLLVSGGHPMRKAPFAEHWLPTNSFKMLREGHRMRREGILPPQIELWAVENPYVNHPSRFEKKLETGAEAIITQPPLLPDAFGLWWEAIAQRGLLADTNVIVGVPFVTSYRSFAFWLDLLGASKLPEGRAEADKFRRQLQTLGSDPDGKALIRSFRRKWILSLMRRVRQLPGVSGMHIMPVTAAGWRDLQTMVKDYPEEFHSSLF
ncbi:hypothetical protein CBR_g41199 [Chara braunii]|uniref:Uncharacterized protein n=1 Tax=Chara braunii TaxID=69332 RepID=A0A388K2N9_CHABU|nr:hypothetical protein CBR_g41199 [Chara braunii]|eukprot:GBG64279.1 hypothetical protein CBR_g41199 [Chara braunii]